MNTLQLENYMLNDPYIRQYYAGTLAVDELPLVVTRPCIFIVNTDPIALPGKHWVTLFMDKQLCEHFDSAGFRPRKDFEIYLTAKGPNYLYNNNRLQNYNTETCGLFCLFYSYFRCRNHNFKEILDMFYDNLKINEALVKYFYVSTV